MANFFPCPNPACTYQFDAKPTFRVLELTITAYLPSLIAPGNGSATSYAIYTFGQTKAELVQPPKHTPEPPAKISPAGGIGNGYGAAATRVNTPGELAPALENAFAGGGVHLVIVPIDYSENKRVLVDELAQRLPVGEGA